MTDLDASHVGITRDFMNELNAIVESAKAAFSVAITPADLENAKAQFLGKSGRITELMKGMAALSVDEKKSRGAAINLSKQAIEAALNDRRQALADASRRFLAPWVLTLPRALKSSPTGLTSPH